jgi:tetratricopeptide (TPR) repeat protein
LKYKVKLTRVIFFLIIILCLFLFSNESSSQELSKLNYQLDSLNMVFKRNIFSNGQKANAYLFLAEKNKKQQQLYNELYFFKQAEKYYDKSRKKELADLYIQIGKLSEAQFDYETALEYYFKSRMLFHEINDLFKENTATEKIAIIYANRGILKTSLKYSHYVRKFYLTNPSRYKKSLSYNSYNLGVVYYRLGKLDSAYYWYKKSFSYIYNNSNLLLVAKLNNNIGNIFYDRNVLDSAFYYFNNAYKAIVSINDEKNLGVVLTSLGEVKLKEKKLDEAFYYLDRSREILEKQKYYNQLLTNYLDLKEYYKLKKDYNTSIDFLEKHLHLKDSIASSEKLNKYAEIEKLNDLRDKDNKIVLMAKEKELITKENRLKTIWQYIFIAGFILLIFIGLLMFRSMMIAIKNKELTEKLHVQEMVQFQKELDFKKIELELNKKDIENKNKDMEHFALRIVDKNQFIEKLDKEIDSLQGTDKDKQRLLKIANEIRNNIALEREVFDIEHKINETYEGFFRKLVEKHPGLSKSEKKLCSLMVLDFDNKQIASLLNITLDGVKKGKNRLRKSLELQLEDDMVTYLKNL